MNNQQLTPRENWAFTVASGLSLLNFLEQNLDDKELAVCLDGWLMWSQTNVCPQDEQRAEELIADIWNKYSASCMTTGGPRLTAQTRLIEVFREREHHV